MSGAGTMRASGSTALVVSAREVVATSGGSGTQAARQASPVPSLLACRRPEALIFQGDLLLLRAPACCPALSASWGQCTCEHHQHFFAVGSRQAERC